MSHDDWQNIFGMTEEPADPEFPDSYTVLENPELKSPLNVLYYQIVFEFPDKYPAKMPPDFARDMILLYSKEGDDVLDLFVGSGTVVRQANKINRRGFGIDVNPKAIALCRNHDPEHADNYQVDDAATFTPDKKPRLILSSSPFGLKIAKDKNNYSDEPKDISNSKTYEQFFEKMEKIIKNAFEILQPGGIMILDGRDRTKNGTYYDLTVEFRNLAKKAGFTVVCRYWYLMIPYRQMTFKHADSRLTVPMVSAMDAYVFYKPIATRLM